MKRTIRLLLFSMINIAGVFYMFILPALVATGVFSDSVESILFAAFMLMQMWMLIIEFAYSTVATIYNFKRRYIFKFIYNLDQSEYYGLN